jgi:hypothetical protein
VYDVDPDNHALNNNKLKQKKMKPHGLQVTSYNPKNKIIQEILGSYTGHVDATGTPSKNLWHGFNQVASQYILQSLKSKSKPN